MIYRDRSEAGKHLAARLAKYANRDDVLVLALPRGGVPVAAPQTCDEYRMGVDEIVCASTPEPFRGVGQWYRDFSQTTDDEVRELLEKAQAGYAVEAEDRELTHA